MLYYGFGFTAFISFYVHNERLSFQKRFQFPCPDTDQNIRCTRDCKFPEFLCEHTSFVTYLLRFCNKISFFAVFDSAQPSL